MIHPSELREHNYVRIHPKKKEGESRADDMKICEVSEICGGHIKVFGHDYELFAGNLTPVFLTPDILNPDVFIEENGSYRFKEVRLIFGKNLPVSVYREGCHDEKAIFTVHEL